MKKSIIFSGISVLLIIYFLPLNSLHCKGDVDKCPTLPMDIQILKKSLSYARGKHHSDGKWPRTISYEYRTYNFRKDVFDYEKKTFSLKNKPLRIIPHAVGIAEILWAICPRKRLIAFNEISADPESSFIADPVKKTGLVFKSRQTELIIGYRPDLVFTVFYSGASFKEKLKQTKTPYLDLGYFGSIESIKKQILLIGEIIGEESNANALVMTIESKIRELQDKIPRTDKPVRVLYYDEGGYIPGKASNFASICNIIRVINVGSEQGIKSWSQIDYETLLKWDPDVIIVPRGSHLKAQLMNNKMLFHARAIKKARVYDVPGRYLAASSQYMVLSASLLAGIVYEKAF